LQQVHGKPITGLAYAYTYKGIKMSDELQNDVDPIAEISDGMDDADHDDSGSDLAPETSGDEESAPQSEEAKAEAKQQAIQETINKKHAQAKQAERERDDALARVAQFEAAQREKEAAQIAAIPDYPDEYDDNFQQKLAERDAALVRQAQFNQSQQSYNQQQQQQAQAQQQKQELATQTAAANYNARATELDISGSVLQAAGQAVAGFGIGEDVVMHILTHKDGPLITKYLADHPVEAIDLAGMSPITQGVYLEQVHSKALAASPKAKKSNAPSPPSDISGAGVNSDSGAFPNSKGATFS
jgi:hypothetical protein